jgi:hypothetical protein
VGTANKKLVNLAMLTLAEPINAGVNTRITLSGRQGPPGTGQDYMLDITTPFQEIIDTLDRSNRWPVNALYP